MSIDLKFVELTADVLEIFFVKCLGRHVSGDVDVDDVDVDINILMLGARKILEPAKILGVCCPPSVGWRCGPFYSYPPPYQLPDAY